MNTDLVFGFVRSIFMIWGTSICVGLMFVSVKQGDSFRALVHIKMALLAIAFFVGAIALK